MNKEMPNTRLPTTKSFFKYIPLALWVIVVVLLYLPLLINGGIIIDDWGGLASNFQCGSIFEACFIERYLDAFYAVFANRPLAPLPIVLSTVLFKTHFTWYLYLNTTIFLAAILTASWVISRIAGQSTALIFSYVAVIPFISMPLVVSPINLMDSTFAYLCWSISICLLYKYCQKKSYLNYFLSYVLLICGFFTYEVFLPLLTINACLPYLINQNLLNKNRIRYAFEYIAPLILVLAIVYLWQKVIGPNFFHFHSRLNFSIANAIPSFFSWLGIFYYDAPNLFLKARKFLSINLLISSLIFVGAMTFSWRMIVNSTRSSEAKVVPYFLVTLLCFLGSSSILMLSGATADIGGYDSRALSSVWICFALFCSGVAALFLKSWPILFKKIAALICLIILFFSSLAFGIQRDNYIKSWAIQIFIIEDAVSLISSSTLEKSATVIGNVPQYLSHNYNNELIFNTYWDFTAALRVFTNERVKGGPVIDAQAGNFHNLRVMNGGLSIDGIKINDFSKLWFYDFDQTLSRGSLVKLNSLQELKAKLASLGNPTYLGELGINSSLERGEILDFSRDWINKHHYIKAGFSERESWGVWSSGKEADLVLPLPQEGAKGLRLDVRAFVVPENPVQQIEISVNDLKLKPVTLSKSSGNQIEIQLPTSISNEEKSIRIHFKFLNAVSPKQLGIGADERTLAIGLEKGIFY